MADLTAKRRDTLPKQDFALPGRRYPIPDEAHARLALAMVAKYGTPEQQAQVRAKVKAKFPEIDQDGGGAKRKDAERKKAGKL